MLNENEKKYINELIESNGKDLSTPAAALFARLRQAKAEGDNAVAAVERLRAEATRYEVMAQNRQGRFDALAELLVDKNAEETKAAEPSGEEENSEKDVEDPDQEPAGENPPDTGPPKD